MSRLPFPRQRRRAKVGFARLHPFVRMDVGVSEQRADAAQHHQRPVEQSEPAARVDRPECAHRRHATMPARRWWPRRQKTAKSSADKKVLVAAPESGAWGDAAANLRVDAPPPARLSPNSPPASVPLPTSVSALHSHGRARSRTALLSRRQCRPVRHARRRQGRHTGPDQKGLQKVRPPYPLFSASSPR